MPAPVPVPGRVGPGHAVPGAPTRGDDVEPFGRESELDILETAVREARDGHAGVIVIEGAAGLGKSVLLRRTARRTWHSGTKAVHVRCESGERDVPFGVVRRLLGSPPAVWPRMAEAAGDTAAGYASHAVLHALFRFTRDLVDRAPLVIAVDDAHHADPASLRFMLHAARRMQGLPILLALSRRAAEPGDHEVRAALLDELAAQPLSRVVLLRPLDLDGVRDLVTGTFGAAADAGLGAACLAGAGGNPLLVRTLLDVLRTRGYPPTLQGLERAASVDGPCLHQAVRTLLRQQSAPAVAAAEAMAVLAEPATAEVCARLAGLDRGAFASAVRSLCSLGLAGAGDGGTWSITGGLVREGIAEGLPADARAAAELNAARLLLDAGADAERVAGHLLRSGLATTEEWAVAVLREAARKASERGAPLLAVQLLRGAVPERAESPADVMALVELGLAEGAVDIHAGVRHLKAALGRVHGPEQRFRVLASLAGGLVRTGQPRQALRVIEEHADGAGAGPADADRDPARVLRAERLMAACEDRGRFVLTATERRGVPDLPADTPGERALLAAYAGIEGVREECAQEAAAAAERVLRRGVIGVDQPFFFITAATVLMYTDRPDKAAAAYARIIDSTRQGRDRPFHSLSTAMGAEAAYRQGRLADAVAETRSVLDDTPPQQWGRTLALPLATRIHALLDRGDVSGAESAAYELAPTSTDSWQWNEFLCARGRLRLAHDQPQAALIDLLECGRRQHAWGRTSPAVSSWWYWAARAHLALGANAQARSLAENAVARARRGGLSGSFGAALHLLALTQNAPLSRLALLKQSLDILQDTPARLEIARVLIEYGAGLHACGRTEAARDTLRRGLDLAHALGASALCARAYNELHATGARPRRAATSGLDSLTPSERHVAQLAATGATNRDIARDLVVTQRTIELHLTSVYRKLGVSGRRDLRDHMTPAPARAETGP